MEQSIIGLFFDAPLQSWDVGSRHSKRGTLPAPTRSGVLGIIAAAMGIDKNSIDEPYHLNRLSVLSMETFLLRPHRELSDYHIAQDCRQADGGIKKHAVITNRSYLMEARFLICISCSEMELIKEIDSALKNPVWGGWLGRKSCIPASPLYLGSFKSELEVKNHISKRCPDLNWTACGKLREVKIGESDSPSLSESVLSIDDVPISFGKREFGSRKVAMTFFNGEA